MSRPTPFEVLILALAEATSAGLRIPCGEGSEDDRAAWLSESYKDRDRAAALCAGCPVLDQCAAYATADRVRFGVWGGRDTTPRRAA